MKKLKTSHKVLLGSSAALLTLLPMVSVVATSCSNTNNSEENKNDTPANPSHDNLYVKTQADQLSQLVSNLQNATKLSEVHQTLNTNDLWTKLGLDSQQARLVFDPQTIINNVINLTIQLKDHWEFNPHLLEQIIPSANISKQAISFNIKTNQPLADDTNYVSLNASDLAKQIQAIQNINNYEQYQKYSSSYLKAVLGLNHENYEVKVTDALNNESPIPGFTQKSIQIRSLDNHKFSNSFVENLKQEIPGLNNYVSLTDNNQTLLINGINTKYQLPTKSVLTVTPENLETLNAKLENSSHIYSESQLQTFINQCLEQTFKLSPLYFSSNLTLNNLATQEAQANVYDLVISPNPALDWKITDNLDSENNPTIEWQNNQIVIKNVKSQIYNTTKTLGQLPSAAWSTNNITDLLKEIRKDASENHLNQTLKQALNLPELPNYQLVSLTTNPDQTVNLQLADDHNRCFEDLNVYLSPSNLNQVIFHKYETNQLENWKQILPPETILTNQSLSKDQLDKVTSDKSEALNSSVIQEIKNKLIQIPEVTSFITNDVLNLFYQQLTKLSDKLGLSLSNISSSFGNYNLSTQVENNNLVVNGSLKFQLTNTAQEPVSIPAHNPLLHNVQTLTLQPQDYLAYELKFDNSHLGFDLLATGLKNVAQLVYNFNNLSQSLIHAHHSASTNYVSQTSLNSLVNLTQHSSLLKVQIKGVNLLPDYFDQGVQNSFNKYLSSLNADKLQNQIQAQNQALIDQILANTKDANLLLTTLSSNPTFAEFLNAFSKPLFRILENKIKNTAIVQLITDLLSTKNWKDFIKRNADVLWELIKQVLPTKPNLLMTVDSKLAMQPTNFIKLPNLELINKLTQLLSNPNNPEYAHKPVLEILSKDLLPSIQKLLDSLKSKFTNNPIFQFVEQLVNLVKTIQTQQKISNILQVRLFDLLTDTQQTDAIINFCNNGLKPLLEKYSPNSINGLDKTVSLMAKIFDIIQKLKIRNPSDIFKSLSQVYVGDSKTPTSWEEVFSKYITITNNPEVSEYNSETHQISFTNTIKFTINQPLKLDLGALKSVFNEVTFDSLTQALGTNLDEIFKKIPGLSLAIDVKKLKPIKLVDLLPNQLVFQADDAMQLLSFADKQTLMPTVENGSITWRTDVPVILQTNFKKTVDQIVKDTADATWSAIKPTTGWLSSVAVKTAVDFAANSVKDFLNSYLNAQFNFGTNYVNKFNKATDSVTLLPFYNSDAANNQYQIQMNPELNSDSLKNILTNPKYYQELSAVNTDWTGKYLSPNNAELTQDLLKAMVVDTESNQWLFKEDSPMMRPQVMVEYVTDKKLDLSINILGASIGKVFNFPGYYKITLQLPTKVKITDSNNQVHFTDHWTISIPYAPVVEAQ